MRFLLDIVPTPESTKYRVRKSNPYPESSSSYSNQPDGRVIRIEVFVRCPPRNQWWCRVQMRLHEPDHARGRFAAERSGGRAGNGAKPVTHRARCRKQPVPAGRSPRLLRTAHMVRSRFKPSWRLRYLNVLPGRRRVQNYSGGVEES